MGGVLEASHYKPENKATFRDLVYYKNQRVGVYFRGDAAAFDNNIAADNQWNLFFAYSQAYRNGAVVGTSKNLNARDRLLLGGENAPRLVGIVLYDGPFELEDVDFLNFSSAVGSPEALGVSSVPFYVIGGANRFVNKVKGLSFVPEPYERMSWGDGSGWADQSFSTSIMDMDGSLTDYSGRVVVHQIPFNDDRDSCTPLAGSFAMVCDYNPVLYFVAGVAKDATFFDVVNPWGDRVYSAGGVSKKYQNKFNTIGGVLGHYTVFPRAAFALASSFEIRMQAEGFGVLGPVVRLFGKRCTIVGVDQYLSLADLEASSGAGYFNDENSTFFRLRTSRRSEQHKAALLSDVHLASAKVNCE